jgi:RNA polymerase sigma-70 factor, ECF subfamily
MHRRPGGRDSESNEDELGRWYDEYAAGLYRYALVVLADHAAAEDAVQQVFAKLLAASPQLETPERYLRRALRNECYSRLAQRGGDRHHRGPARGLLEPSTEQAHAVDHAERLAIEAALQALPAEQREVIVLKVYEGWTLQEIAEGFGIPMNTVASRYRYALDKLRGMLAAPLKEER